MARTIHVGNCRSTPTRFPLGSVDDIKPSTLINVLAILHDVAAECVRNVVDTKPLFALAKSGYLIGGYIPSIHNLGLEGAIIREAPEYEKRVQGALVTDLFGSSCDIRTSFVLIPVVDRKAVADGLRR